MDGRRRVLVVGLDGADPDVLRALAAAGRLPNLAAWMREAPLAPLPSTTPPMSFPAWTSFATGLGPGRHGLFDFTQKLPGAYRLRFVNAADRHGTPFWMDVARAGGSALVLGVPATFPPDPLPRCGATGAGGAGLLVPGFDAPVSSGSDAAASSDPALYARIAARAGHWMRPDLDEAARGPDWHDRAAAALLARIDRKTGFALEALRQLREAGREPALAVVVFSESDTVAHHFWRDHDPASPRHDPAASAARRGALAAVYERLDAAAGALRAAFGDGALCVVLSDHGQGGASRYVAHPNRRLAECGLLARRGGARAPALDRAARGARDLALRALPPRAAEAVFRRLRGSAARVESLVRFGGFDWTRTAAFCEEANTQPGVWINLRGREAAGCVAPGDYERVRQEVIDALLAWRVPGSDRPVVARACRREELYEGPLVARAPDVVFELGDQDGYRHVVVPTPWSEPRGPALRRLEDHELAGGRGRGTNGTHRPDGVWLAVGGGAAERAAPASICEVAAHLRAALGVAPADGPPAPGTRYDYAPDEEARVAARLRALGYLE